MAFGLTDTSRLGCQVHLTKELDGMTATLPSATRNMFVDGMWRPFPVQYRYNWCASRQETHTSLMHTTHAYLSHLDSTFSSNGVAVPADAYRLVGDFSNCKRTKGIPIQCVACMLMISVLWFSFRAFCARLARSDAASSRRCLAGLPLGAMVSHLAVGSSCPDGQERETAM